MFESVEGGVYSIETTFNAEQDTWHVHLHAIIDSDYIPQWQLAYTWALITGDSFIVDIREVDDSAGAVREVLKYVVKGSNFLAKPARVDEYLRATENLSLTEFFGFCRGVKFQRQSGGFKCGCPIPCTWVYFFAAPLSEMKSIDGVWEWVGRGS